MSALHDELSPWIGGDWTAREAEAAEPFGDLHGPIEKAKPEPLEKTPPRERRNWWTTGVFASASWLAVAALTQKVPDFDDWERTGLLAALMTAVAVFIALAVEGEHILGQEFARLRRAGPWLVAVALALGAWELVTAKFAWLPRPFFAPPQALLEVFTDDNERLGVSVLHSLRLLAGGYAIGASAGFVAGVAIGWSRLVGYWAHPVLRLLGPLPATAWLPIAFFLFPTSFSASIFLVALATWFPVTVLTWSGVAGINKAYYDVARTLGAGPRFLIFKVAIPAACRLCSSACSWGSGRHSRCWSWPR